MSRRVYFFDLDGTLIDPSLGLKGCTRHALEALGRSCPGDDVLTSFIGPPLRQMFATLLESGDSTMIEEAVGLFRQRYRERFLVETRLYEDVPVMLQHARSGASAMFIMTSKPATFAERIVDHFEIAPYFDKVYGNGLDGRFDNKADLIGHALAVEGIPPDEALMIGDRAVDVVAAHAHGIPTIGVLWGYGSRDELRQAGASQLCGTPRELAEYLSPTPSRATVRE